MLRFYWSLGHDMDEKRKLYHWGSNFYEQVGKDLRKELPDVKSFSARNLRYMPISGICTSSTAFFQFCNKLLQN